MRLPHSSCLVLLLGLSLLSPAAWAQLGSDQSGNDPFARLQFIHNMVNTGPLDVYLDDKRWLDDVEYRAATSFLLIPNGSHKVDLVAAADTANTTPLWTGLLSALSQQRYLLAAFGDVNNAQVILRQNVRETSSFTGETEFFVIHAAPDTGPIDILLRDPSKGNTLIDLVWNNLPFGATGIYVHQPPREYNFEVTTADNRRVIDVFHFNLSSFGGRAFVLITSGTGMSAREGFALIGYDETGEAVYPAITTTATDEAAALPSTFALEQNYPNPFNPATQIRYALPHPAAVRLTVYDALGRAVHTLVEAEQPAGSYTVRWDGRNEAGALVPSGVYLYRLATDGFSTTRRMLFVK